MDRKATQIRLGRREWNPWVLEEAPSSVVIRQALVEAGFIHHGDGVYHLKEEVLACVSEVFVMVCVCGDDRKQKYEIVYFESRAILWDVVRGLWRS